MYKLLVIKTSQNKRTNIKRYHTLVFFYLIKNLSLKHNNYIFPEI